MRKLLNERTGCLIAGQCEKEKTFGAASEGLFYSLCAAGLEVYQRIKSFHNAQGFTLKQPHDNVRSYSHSIRKGGKITQPPHSAHFRRAPYEPVKYNGASFSRRTHSGSSTANATNRHTCDRGRIPQPSRTRLWPSAGRRNFPQHRQRGAAEYRPGAHDRTHG